MGPPDARRFEVARQENPVCTGLDFDRDVEPPFGGIPAQFELGFVDQDPRVGAADLADISGAGNDAAIQRLRHSVFVDLGADHGRKRHVSLQISGSEAQRQQDILGRDVTDDGVDRTTAVAAWHHGCVDRPWTVGSHRTQRKRSTAVLRARQAQVDVRKIQKLAVALIVDRDCAALQSDLDEVTAIQADGVQVLQPLKQNGEQIGTICGRYVLARCRGGIHHRCRERTVRRFASGGRRRERLLLTAREHHELSVSLDANRHFGADQAQALGPHMAHHQTGDGDPNFRLGCGRNDRRRRHRAR